MRKTLVIFLLIGALLLSGCASEPAPLPSIPGWQEDWVRMGPLLGIAPLAEFSLDDYEDSQAVKGIYYATWVMGQAKEDSDDGVKAYDAQIYVMLKQCPSAEEAKTEIDTWSGWEKEAYQTGRAETLTCGNQAFQVLPLEKNLEDNPYSHGIAAFAVRGSWAVSVELLCREDFDGDPQRILNDFLSCFHYSEE